MKAIVKRGLKIAGGVCRTFFRTNSYPPGDSNPSGIVDQSEYRIEIYLIHYPARRPLERHYTSAIR